MRNFLILILSFAVLFSCDSKKERKLIIATAASAQFAIKDIAAQFSKKNNVKVDVILGSSGKLTTQIINGAPYDLFFSANMKYPNVLVEKGKTENEPLIFANGVPVIWYVKGDNKISSSFLQNSIIEKIVIAEPKNAPYGEAAVSFFKDERVYETIESKLVYGESISQVNEYILNKTADIGVTAKSIVVSPKLKGVGNFMDLPSKYWIKQGVVIIKNDNESKLKDDFLKYVTSPEGIKILENYGYSI